MQEERLFFSVVIPTYNRAAFVKQAVSSVLSQRFDSFEVIVVDDGSTDATQETLALFAGKIRVIIQENKGPEEARNAGIGAASGEYLVFLDSDDLLLPDALSVYRNVIEQTGAMLVIAHGEGFENGRNPLSRVDAGRPQFVVYKDVLAKEQTMWLSTSFIIVNRRCVDEQKLFFRRGTVDDLDFLLCAGCTGPCVFINQPVTVGYRLHEANLIRDIVKNMENCEGVLALENRGEYPGGMARRFDRLALIGGHVQCWGRKGLRAGFIGTSCRLFIKGFLSLCAVVSKKIQIKAS